MDLYIYIYIQCVVSSGKRFQFQPTFSPKVKVQKSRMTKLKNICLRIAKPPTGEGCTLLSKVSGHLLRCFQCLLGARACSQDYLESSAWRFHEARTSRLRCTQTAQLYEASRRTTQGSAVERGFRKILRLYVLWQGHSIVTGVSFLGSLEIVCLRFMSWHDLQWQVRNPFSPLDQIISNTSLALWSRGNDIPFSM